MPMVAQQNHTRAVASPSLRLENKGRSRSPEKVASLVRRRPVAETWRESRGAATSTSSATAFMMSSVSQVMAPLR